MEKQSINLTLPYPPTTNHLYRTLLHKGKIFRVKTGTAKKYATQVLKICQVAQIKPYIGEVGVVINVYRPRRVGDLDGVFKVIFDSLKGSAYLDDKQIVEINARRFEDPKNPRVEIEINAKGLY